MLDKHLHIRTDSVSWREKQIASIYSPNVMQLHVSDGELEKTFTSKKEIAEVKKYLHAICEHIAKEGYDTLWVQYY